MRYRARRSVVVAAALTVAVTAFAVSAQSVFRYVDPDGRVVYSDRPPPPDVKNVQTKRLGANYVETSEPSLTAQMAAERFPATLYTFDCGEVCQNAEGLLNRRGVPFATVDVQKDEQGLARLRTLTGEESAPVLTLGDKIVVKGYSESRWQAALDEAGYPKAQAQRRGPAVGRSEPGTTAATQGSRAVAPTAKGGDYPK
ncbi:MAG: glutaredoxin family protein [Burkholderiales bacterium]|nr:glutaredoxin family protein [Burkholderiales bacterium]